MNKDLPGLSQLPWDFKACLLKGRSNYISLRRWRRYLAEPCDNAEELRFRLKVLVWLHTTESGDRSELRLQGREEVLWTHIASDPLDCVGVRCTAEDCYVHRARAEAEASDLVVVNHALLLADAEVGGGLLPDYDHLVVDEAHHLEESATQGLRQEVDGPGLEALLDRLASRPAGTASAAGLLEELRAQPRLGSASNELESAIALATGARSRVHDLFAIATDFVLERLSDGERREESLRLTPQLREDEDWDGVELAGESAATSLAALETTLRAAVTLARDWLGGEEADQGVRELEIIRGRLQGALLLIGEALTNPHPNRVYWFAQTQKDDTVLLRSAPLNVGALLRDRVYAERRSIVFTSATLTVGGTFDYFRSRIGLGEDEDFDRAVEDTVAETARRAGGRTLVLFTSHRQLRDIHTALKHRVDLDELLILGQGIDGQRRQLLKSFQETDRTLLLGTSTFWEGIDVPGDRLSCVIVVRLPFAVPTEPVFAARAEQLRDSFSQLALPQAALRLKQGFGRLIRTSTDRGVVIILDHRILGRDYGRAFLEVLPPASRFVGPASEIPDQVATWLG